MYLILNVTVYWAVSLKRLNKNRNGKSIQYLYRVVDYEPAGLTKCFPKKSGLL